MAACDHYPPIYAFPISGITEAHAITPSLVVEMRILLAYHHHHRPPHLCLEP
jgi:hypothetical protein